MELYTIQELARKDDRELDAIFNRAAEAVAATEPGTPQHHKALACLQSVSRMQGAKTRVAVLDMPAM